jgi:hypothetical protein
MSQRAEVAAYLFEHFIGAQGSSGRKSISEILEVLRNFGEFEVSQTRYNSRRCLYTVDLSNISSRARSGLELARFLLI